MKISNNQLNRLAVVHCMENFWKSPEKIAEQSSWNNFAPTIDANDALQVIEAMRMKGWDCTLAGEKFQNYCQFKMVVEGKMDRIHLHYGQNFPLAITIAALKALGVEVD